MAAETTSATFNAIWFAPSLILGLGITRLFSDSIRLFRSRSKARMDWLPMMWAICVFVWQIQYLWAVIELAKFVMNWTLFDFLLLIGLSLSLFVAGALVLPDIELREGDDLGQSFSRDGRWALAALSIWGFLALVTDWSLFGSDFVTRETALMSTATVTPILFLLIRNRTLKVGITLVYFVTTFVSAWILSPKAY